MTRPAVLRAGYASLALAFAALAGSAYSGMLLLPALVLAFAGAILLLFSGDDLPRWAGVVLLAYFVLIAIAFILSTGVTIRKGGAYGIEAPDRELAVDVTYYLGLALPLMLALAAVAAAWERENAARFLLVGGTGGFLVAAALTTVLDPSGVDAAASQGNLLELLFALSAIAAATGAGWSAARPEEYA